MLVQLAITRLLAGLVLATIDVSAWYEMYYEPGSQMADYLAAREASMAYESRDDEWGQHRRRRRPRHPLLVNSYDITNYDSTDYVRDITFHAKKMLSSVTDMFYRLNQRNLDDKETNITYSIWGGIFQCIADVVSGGFGLLFKLLSFNTLMKEKGVKAGDIASKKDDQGPIEKQIDKAEKSDKAEKPEKIGKTEMSADTND